PGCRSPVANKCRERKQLPRVGLGFRRADRPAGFRADGDEIIIAGGDSASIEVQAKTELRQKQEFVFDECRTPTARRGRSLDRVEQAFESFVQAPIGLTLRKSR